MLHQNPSALAIHTHPDSPSYGPFHRIITPHHGTKRGKSAIQAPKLPRPNSNHHHQSITDSARDPQVSSKRTSKRFSTYSSLLSSDSHTLPSAASANARTTTNTSSSTNTSNDRLAEIKEWSTGFDRLDNKRLQQQRYQPTPEKSENLSKLALGAKVERALGRRLTDQDATFRTKVVSEKPTAVQRSVTTAS